MLYNATLGTALGRLQRMRETKEWRAARDMPKGRARTKAFTAVHNSFGLSKQLSTKVESFIVTC